MNKKNLNRVIWLDYARTFAIICVIITHVTERVYTLNADWMLQANVCTRVYSYFLFTLGRLGVPIFLFLTGYLLLDKEYTSAMILRLYKKNLFNLLVTTWIWIIVYNVFNALLFKTPISIFTIIKNMLFLQQTNMSHMWYMPVIIGMYLFIPLIANGLKHIDTNSLYLPLGIAFVYICVIPTVNVILRLFNVSTVLYPLLDCSFSGGVYGLCLLLGYLVKKGSFDKWKSSSISIIGCGSFILAVLLQVISIQHSVTNNVWYDSFLLLNSSLSVFLSISRLNLQYSKLIQNLSIDSFGIYLIHNPIILILLRYLHIQSRFLSVAIILVLTVLVSFSIAEICKKNKHIGQILLYIK